MGYHTQTKPRKSSALKPEDAAAKDEEIATFERHDKYVKSSLLLALDNKHVKIVLKCTTVKEIWGRLSAIHEQKSAANKINLQKEFFEVQR